MRWWSPKSGFRVSDAADLEPLLSKLLALEPIVRVSFETGAVMRDMIYRWMDYRWMEMEVLRWAEMGWKMKGKRETKVVSRWDQPLLKLLHACKLLIREVPAGAKQEPRIGECVEEESLEFGTWDTAPQPVWADPSLVSSTFPC